jgi:hypothetical protein
MLSWAEYSKHARFARLHVATNKKAGNAGFSVAARAQVRT